MSEPFLGQIEIFGFSFPPKRWTFCAGQLMSIQQNTALFSLLGTFYGGNGQTTFGLPDLRGRLPVGLGPNWTLGQTGGTESVTLAATQMPGHSHTLRASSPAADDTNTVVPGPLVGLGQSRGHDDAGKAMVVNDYVVDPNPAAVMHPSAISPQGGQPHENRMPLLALNFCICLAGVFPSRN